MNKSEKNKVSGIAGTILFHIGAMLLLIFLALRTPLPLPGEEGVEVNLGWDETGMGTDQQLEPAPAEALPPPPAQQQEPEEEEYITQDIEEAPVIEKKKAEPKKKAPEKVIPKPAPEPVEEVTEPEPVPEPQVIQRALYKGKSTTGTQGGQEGITGQPGDQGNPNGTPGVANYEGNGGAGNGISFSLGGRGSLSLHKPSYDSKEQGKVVVTIKVDRQGNVISAVSGVRGTNVSDETLWNLAKDAALRSKFSADPNAPDFQVGTITYNFIRQN